MDMEVRKIVTEQEKQRKDKRNKIIIGIVLAVIMLFSTAGYFVMEFTGSSGTSGNAKTIEYNNIKFSQDAYGYWTFSIQGYNFQMQYNPNEIENISVNTNKTLNDFSGKTLYYSAEPSEDYISQQGISEIGRNIGQFVQRANPACLGNCSQDYPIKNCLNDSIVIFKESASNLSRITDRDNCVVLEYSQLEDARVADAFLFRIFGIK